MQKATQTLYIHLIPNKLKGRPVTDVLRYFNLTPNKPNHQLPTTRHVLPGKLDTHAPWTLNLDHNTPTPALATTML